MLFLNGDPVSGKILKAVDGKLTITTEGAGDVVVDMSKVKAFSTDAPVTVGVKAQPPVSAEVAAAPAINRSNEAGLVWVYENYKRTGSSKFFGPGLAYSVDWVPFEPLTPGGYSGTPSTAYMPRVSGLGSPHRPNHRR